MSSGCELCLVAKATDGEEEAEELEKRTAVVNHDTILVRVEGCNLTSSYHFMHFTLNRHIHIRH